MACELLDKIPIASLWVRIPAVGALSWISHRFDISLEVRELRAAGLFENDFDILGSMGVWSLPRNWKYPLDGAASVRVKWEGLIYHCPRLFYFRL